MLSISTVQSISPQDWDDLEEALAHLAKDTDEATNGLQECGTAAVEEHWADVVGQEASAKLKASAAGYQIVGIQLRAVARWRRAVPPTHRSRP